ncbi:MAG: ATP-binding protein [Gammaproteobacteria bacterium]|nr:ATP-binding protein [Gammaproteobacteria bacterium]
MKKRFGAGCKPAPTGSVCHYLIVLEHRRGIVPKPFFRQLATELRRWQNITMAEITKNHDFSAFSGKSGQSGLPPEEERLARICRSPRRNPYCFGTALQAGSSVFIGRKREIHEISASLRRAKPANISLLGERRGGKSSLLRQIVKNLENEEGLVVILGDAQHWSQNSREHFFANLHAAICKALDDDSGPVNRYDDFHAFIQRRAKHYRFVLIIDEFEEMAVNPEFDADFFTCLRALGNDDRCNFGYLLASRFSLEKIWAWFNS